MCCFDTTAQCLIFSLVLIIIPTASSTSYKFIDFYATSFQMFHRIVPELAQRDHHHLLPSNSHFKPVLGFTEMLHC